MAGAPSGLIASIRQKLRDGKSPEDIVHELVAGGMTEVSANRFVDRAIAEDASAAALSPDGAAAADSLDQYMHTRTADAAEANAKTGGKQLWIAAALMCGGIIISAVSYTMAGVGERYIMMWGPMLFGLLAWGQAVFKGREDGPDFAWSTAAITLALPVVLGAAALGVIAMTAPEEEGALQAQMDEIFDPSKSPARNAAPGITITSAAPASAEPGALELVKIFENNPRSPEIQCEMTRRLAEVSQDEKAIAAVSLMAQLGNTADEVKICIARAMKKLEPKMALEIYGDWSTGTNQTLKDAALKERP